MIPVLTVVDLLPFALALALLANCLGWLEKNDTFRGSIWLLWVVAMGSVALANVYGYSADGRDLLVFYSGLAALGVWAIRQYRLRRKEDRSKQ